MSTSSVLRQIVVDDNDPRIVYSSDFFVDNTGSQDAKGNFGATLKSSLHGTNKSGSFQFPFSGTQVFVYGTSSGHSADPTWECFIDNVSIGRTDPFQFAENNWLFCSSEILADTSHLLTVNANSKGHTFWFDYLRYTPSANAFLGDALVYIDNTDPAIRYDSDWRPLGNVANMTSSTGSTVAFDFLGVSLEWYSLVPTELSHAPSLATYSIDGGASAGVALPGLDSSSNVSEFNQLIFQTPILTYGAHLIAVTFQSNSNSTPLTLSYLLVQNETQTSEPGPSASLAIPTESPSLSSTTAAVKRPNVGSIVGGVLGALLFLLSIVAAYFFFIRYRRKRLDSSTVRNTIPVPFQASPRPNPRSSGLNRASSRHSLDHFADEYPFQPIVLAQPPSHRRRHSHGNRRQNAQPSGSSQMATQERIEEVDDENMPYYGGYQTWGQTKALEAKAHGHRPHDSYI